MINLFKKNIHSFLSFTTTDTTTTTSTTTSSSDYKLQLQRPSHNSILGLGLINATRVTNRPLNVLESATLKPNNNNPSPTSPFKRIGFIDDDISDEVDGLMSCTESLGFESSNKRVDDDQIDQIQSKNDNDNEYDDKKKDNDEDDDDDLGRRRMTMRAEGRGNWKKVRSFPPPLSWLNRNGKPSFVLRPVRKDGRLELTEVRIQRPEIMHAWRHDGRLTLHLIPDHSIEEEEEEEEEEVDALLDEEVIVDEEEELDTILDEEIMVEEEEQQQLDTMVDEEEERVGMGGNEGLRRCYEMVNQHHHHHHVHGSHHTPHMRMCGINICVPC